MTQYEPLQIEAKWRRRWEDSDANTVDLHDSTRPPLYCLVMFSYPSGNKLHLGHWFNYAPTDTWARYRRMLGDNVFQPMGFDSFGLPAENYAIKMGVHPKTHTEQNIAFIRDQLKNIGAMYDWSYELETHDPHYYKWTQWLFLELYKAGLAYRRAAPVNWCDSCQTVLANEQVVAGLCERCDSAVRRRHLTQWFFKITDFAEDLLDGLDRIDWPTNTVAMQKNWIGRSEGALVVFTLDEASLPAGAPLDPELPIFTTRPDTLFGVTYMVLAPEHPLVDAITTPEQRAAVDAYVDAAARLSEIERTSTVREKTGVFTGAYAVNPLNGEKVPIWVADYVLASYGTGAIMAVPGHDERDFEFARTFGLEIRRVIVGPEGDADAPLDEAYTGDGPMCRSGRFDGLAGPEARQRVNDFLAEHGLGKGTINYRLRDWLVSRQRYWGAPIPIVHCDSCGEVAVPTEQLPVLLPEDVELKPTGESPLKRHATWRHTQCPCCGGPAERDADTMDTFVDSSWYFLRYLSPQRDDAAFDDALMKKWLPVDTYVGGREHAVMHLLYARFFIKALHRLGRVDFDEPFQRLVHQGVITAEGARMSKSRGNVVNPEEYLEKYGSDALRMYLMFGFSFTDGGDWDASGIHAIHRYLARVFRLLDEHRSDLESAAERDDSADDPSIDELRYTRHNSVKMATQDLDRFQFNTAIARHMELTNALQAYLSQVDPALFRRELHDIVTDWILLLAPFAPHAGEELWERLGGTASVFDRHWPSWNEDVLKRDMVTVVIQVNGKVRDQIELERDLARDKVLELATSHGRIPGWLEGKELRKAIVVPNKLVNLVVS